MQATDIQRFRFSAVNRCALAVAVACAGMAGEPLAQTPAQVPTELPAVVVKDVTPAQQTKKELESEQARTPGGVTLVDGETLYQRNVSNLADMLRYVPGVWGASSSGGDAVFFTSRGSNLDATNYDMNGIKLLQDGLPVTTADGNNHNRMIDPLAARYIVVARGANALTYGASTLGGVIDFITPTALDSAPLELYFNGGSWGSFQGRLTAGKVAGNLDALGTLEVKRLDGYRDHSNQQREGLYANAGWQLGGGVQTRFYLTSINSDEQLPGVLTRAQYAANPRQAEAAAIVGDYQLNVDTVRFANKTTWNLDANSNLSLGLSFEQQQLYHPIVQNPFFSLLIDTKQRNLGGSLRYHTRTGSHDVLAGINYGYSTVKGGNFGNNAGLPTFLMWTSDNQADTTELFVMDRWRFAPQWTAVYGAQGVLADRNVREITVGTGAVRNVNGDYNSINPRVGIIHHLSPRADLFANVSRLYEAPTNFELADDARGNNQPLKAMHGTVLEVGTRGTQAAGTSQWRWDLALYYARVRDEILSVDDPLAPGTSLSTNIDKTTHAGIEALVGASFPLADGGHRIEPLVNLTVNHFRFDSDRVYGNNRLPAAPDYAVRAEVLYRNAEGFYAGPTFDLVGDRYADMINTYQIDSYALWGLRAGVARKNWEVFAELRNLADRNYVAMSRVVDVATPNSALLYPGEPRSAYVGVRMKF